MLAKVFALALIIAGFCGAECAEEPVNMFPKILGLANPVQDHRLEKRQSILRRCSSTDLFNFYDTLPDSCSDALIAGNSLDFTDPSAVSSLYRTVCQSSCVSPLAQFYTIRCGADQLAESLAVICSTNGNGVKCYNILPLFNTLLPNIFTRCPTQSQIRQLEDFGCCGNYISLGVVSELIGGDVGQRYRQCGFFAPSQRCSITTVDFDAAGPTAAASTVQGSTAALQIVIALLMMAVALVNF